MPRAHFADIGVDGVVLGFLKDGWIDHQLVVRVLACAPNVRATFHRAFEEMSDPLRAIAELKRHRQIDRILTSGGSDTWEDKRERFAAWQQAAQPEIEILVGGGTDEETVRWMKPAGIREFHIGKAVREGNKIDGEVLSERVRDLAEFLQGAATPGRKFL